MTGVVSTLSDSVDFAPPQPILGFLLGNINEKNLRKYRSAALLKRHQCWRPAALIAATGEFHAEWRSYIKPAPDKSGFDLCSRVIDERTERQDAEGSFHDWPHSLL